MEVFQSGISDYQTTGNVSIVPSITMIITAGTAATFIVIQNVIDNDNAYIYSTIIVNTISIIIITITIQSFPTVCLRILGDLGIFFKSPFFFPLGLQRD